MWKNLCEEELFLQYQPSKAVVRQLDTDPVTHFVNLVRNQTSNYRNTIAGSLRIPYSKDPSKDIEQKFDWFPPAADSDNRRLFLFIHGGYWQECSLDESSSFAGRLTESGYTFVSLGYDLADPDKNIDLFHIVKQVRQGLRAVLNRAKSHRINSIVLSGHSAGAHLVAMILANVAVDTGDDLLTEEEISLVHHAILFDGLYDIQPIALIKDLNEKLRLTESTAEKLSPINYVDEIVRRSAKILVISGEHSNLEFQRQNQDFSDTINSRGRNCQSKYHREDIVDHFSMIELLDNPEFPLWKVINNFLNY